MNKRIWMAVLVVVFTAALLPLSACTPAEPASTSKLPDVIGIGSLGVGSEAYTASAGLAQAVTKGTGIPTKVIGYASTVGRVVSQLKGDTQIQHMGGETVIIVTRGLAEFADTGPQKLRLVARGNDITVGFMVRGDSGIKQVSDLRGKKVAVPTGVTPHVLGIEAYLAFGNLTWKDVTRVNFATYADAMASVLAGTADVAYGSSFHAAAMELETSRYGISWLSFPAADKAAWDRMNNVQPWYNPLKVTSGAGITPAKPVDMAVVPYVWGAFDWHSDELIYAVTKALYENYDVYKDIHSVLKEWSPEGISRTYDVFCPAHPGFIQMLKEKGVWTDKHQAWQDLQLKQEQERLDKWQTKK